MNRKYRCQWKFLCSYIKDSTRTKSFLIETLHLSQYLLLDAIKRVFYAYTFFYSEVICVYMFLYIYKGLSMALIFFKPFISSQVTLYTFFPGDLQCLQ